MLFCVLLFACATTFSQSISGNMNAEKSGAALRYGTVDIYKNDKLVASVLTDKLGNFSVALDTGMYVCVLNIAGYESITKKVHVTKDESANFSMKEDAVAMERMKKSEKERISVTPIYRPTKAVLSDRIDRSTIVDEKTAVSPSGKPGLLTAGEVNDFSKWKLWQKYTDLELSKCMNEWQISPTGRYTVQVESDNGLPIVNAKVFLLEGQKVLFQTRTDNTGKAECWLTIKNEKPILTDKLTMKIEYKGKSTILKNVKEFEKGLNYQQLEVVCEEVENVDIAFVVDATGSMGDEISFLQAEMNEIMFQSKQISNRLNFRFANVYYRDQGDEYVTKSMDFTRVLTESAAFINAQHAGGGGDFPEAMDVALDSAINNLSWSEEARARILFLVLDAPPHKEGKFTEKIESLIRGAASKGIRIVPIASSGIDKSTEYLLRALAIGTNGTYTFLTNHSGIGGHHIEPTTDKYDVETLNKLLERIVKSYTYMPNCEQKIPDLNMQYPDSIVQSPQKTDSTDTAQKPILIRWSYYPNPTSGIVNILPDSDIKELYLSDLSGKVLQVFTNIKKDQRIQVDLSTYVTGIYLIRYLNEDDNWLSGKIILQKNL